MSSVVWSSVDFTGRSLGMEPTPKIATASFVEAMKEDMERYLQEVLEAVHNAPDGNWIGGSEEQVRDLSAEFRRRVFEKAMQMKIDAAEASFPPSARPTDGQTPGEQGAADTGRPHGQRAHPPEASLVAQSHPRKRRPGRRSH
jgi:hypothetical protein